MINASLLEKGVAIIVTKIAIKTNICTSVDLSFDFTVIE
jgi:hypothetical protein